MAELQESFWDDPKSQKEFWVDLLDFIEEGKVIPVIGSELVTVREGDREVPLVCWIAKRLAADLSLPIGKLPEGVDLNDVVSMHLRQHGEREREELYAKIHRMLRNATLTPPESLLALSSIPKLDLFVSLTFDSLLADALGAVQKISYSPKIVRDLSCPKSELRQP